MNDTTWFWQIVDARGLADVSSDEFVALNELISKAERFEGLEKAASEVAAWWQEEGHYHFNGVPNAISAALTAISAPPTSSGRNLADATSNHTEESKGS